MPAARPTRRIVLTGGPGGGKTTALDLFHREIGDSVVVVPEAASLLYRGGFPRSDSLEARRFGQQAIFHLQRNLEDIHAAISPGRLLLCDRGTPDSAAYWPGRAEELFAAVGSSLDAELARYEAVLFFETAAAGGIRVALDPVRTEDVPHAVALDERLHAVWSRHPRFVLIPHNTSFLAKIQAGLAALTRLVGERGPGDAVHGAPPLYGILSEGG
jgi:predicted ATPase